MATFVIQPHFRLHEWIAEEKGFFRAEGLAYEFLETIRSTDGAAHASPDRVGAYQTIEGGRPSTISCACHWTVNVAASAGHDKIFADAYSVAPSAVLVPTDSDIRTPADLKGVPISVGHQSGSHYSTIQALEPYLALEDITLSFSEGMLFHRMEQLIDGDIPAAGLFSGPLYFAEQLGFRKIIDTTFMMAATVKPDADPDDVRKYYRALKRAQAELDLRPDLYLHYYEREFPERFHARMDTRRWGPGERIVFEPYSKDIFDRTFAWVGERGIFPPDTMGSGVYEDAIYSLDAA